MKKLQDAKIVEKHWIWAIAPVVIFLVAVIVFASFAGINKDITKGMNIGIDFAGGSILTVELGSDVLNNSDEYDKHYKAIEDILTSNEIAKQVVDYAKEQFGIEISESSAVASISYVQTSGSGSEMALVIKYDNISSTFDTKNNDLTTQRNKLLENKIKDYYNTQYPDENITISTSYIGATASASLIKTALIAVFVSLILILVYIMIRFEIWSGISAIIGLIHDVAMMVCLVAIFRIQVNSAFIAALITIVSYSINNTIVVFDRVRENRKKFGGKVKGSIIDNNKMVNESIIQTLSRSVNSTITTMVAITLFAIIGTASVREFALPVIFGLLAGFYSSLVIAPSLYCLMKNSADKRKIAKRDGVIKSKPKYAGAKNN
ncbi:MAG: protein translocase subunit SecF [Clostridia bacterium]|nr:protein translocase subunit SecF [Clostridia bacterium]MDE6471800.1 protein translocase subunit SecF [Clostridia bacterium]